MMLIVSSYKFVRYLVKNVGVVMYSFVLQDPQKAELEGEPGNEAN